MYNLHLFLLRYKWYRALMLDSQNFTTARFVALVCSVAFLFLLTESLLKSIVSLTFALLNTYFSYLRLQMINSESKKEKVEKVLVYMNIVLWTLVSCLFAMDVLFVIANV